MIAKKIDNYLFEDNLKRYLLKDMLIRKEYLKNLTLGQLDSLIRDINVLMNNLERDFKRSEKIIAVSDDSNWEGNHLFKNLILYNCLNIKSDDTTNDDAKRFSAMLKERWSDTK
jgi:hypothetical protein